MNSIAAKLSAAALRDVPIEGIGVFRVHRITTADVLMAGGSFLLAAAREVQTPAGDESQAEQIERVGREMMADPEKIAASARYRATIVCAGVQQSSEDGKTWEPLTIVEKGASEPGANRLNVADLPQDVVVTLSDAILDLSMGGAARDGVNGFPRGGVAVAPTPGP